MASKAAAGNPFAVARDKLVANIAVHPPTSYKGRLLTLAGLAGLLFILCIVTLTLTMVDLRRRSKKLFLVRLQRLQGGSIIVLNALTLYTMLTALSSIAIIASSIRLYFTYFKQKSSTGQTILTLLAWTPGLLGCVVYSYGNLAALVGLKKSGGFKNASRMTIWGHNIGLIGVVILWFGSMIPLAIQASRFGDSLLVSATSLIQLLTRASQSAAVTAGLEFLPQISELQATLVNSQAQAKKKVYALVSIATTYCVLLALVAICSVSLVLQLRKQAKWNLNRHDPTSNSVFLRVEQTTQIDGPVDTTEKSNSPAIFPPNPSALSTNIPTRNPFSNALNLASPRKHQVTAATADDIALARLSSDLTASLPIMVIICITVPIMAFLGIPDARRQWHTREISTDGVGWILILCGIFVQSYFILNFIYNPLARTSGSGLERGSGSKSDPTAVTSPRSRSFQIKIAKLHGQDGLDHNSTHVPLEVFSPTKEDSMYKNKDDLAAESEKW